MLSSQTMNYYFPIFLALFYLVKTISSFESFPLKKKVLKIMDFFGLVPDQYLLVLLFWQLKYFSS